MEDNSSSNGLFEVYVGVLVGNTMSPYEHRKDGKVVQIDDGMAGRTVTCIVVKGGLFRRATHGVSSRVTREEDG